MCWWWSLVGEHGTCWFIISRVVERDMCWWWSHAVKHDMLMVTPTACVAGREYCGCDSWDGQWAVLTSDGAAHTDTGVWGLGSPLCSHRKDVTVDSVCVCVLCVDGCMCVYACVCAHKRYCNEQRKLPALADMWLCERLRDRGWGENYLRWIIKNIF